jgi:hypothetical protein
MTNPRVTMATPGTRGLATTYGYYGDWAVTSWHDGAGKGDDWLSGCLCGVSVFRSRNVKKLLAMVRAPCSNTIAVIYRRQFASQSSPHLRSLCDDGVLRWPIALESSPNFVCTSVNLCVFLSGLEFYQEFFLQNCQLSGSKDVDCTWRAMHFCVS